MLSDEVFRERLSEILARSGGSMRSLSVAMGRDPGYVAALLDPARPSRARPTPTDLLRLSDATSIPLVDLFDRLWGIGRERIAGELHALGSGSSLEAQLAGLTDAERLTILELISFFSARHTRPAGRPGRREAR